MKKFPDVTYICGVEAYEGGAMRFLAVLACLFATSNLLLVGCVSPGEIAARNDEADDATCKGYGAQPGSDAYTLCRMNAANARQAKADSDLNAAHRP